MSRWTVRRLPKKPQHKPHQSKPQFFAAVKVTWHNGKVECGKMFSKDSQSIIRIHNRNVKYLEDALRSNATVEVR